MAEATPVVDKFEDLLTCTICLESFKEPKYLPCLHTFCEACINTYILSSLEKGKCDRFQCPVCRQLVSYSGAKGKPETWASSLPGNHFVISLLEKWAIQKSEKLCNACIIKNEKKNAVSWCNVCEEAYCDQCEKNHKTFKLLSKHNIIPLKDIQTGKSDFKISENVFCDEHLDKIVEVYCVDHSKPCCTLCATLSHRKCENVISLEKAASGVKDSAQTSDLSEKLQETIKLLTGIIQNRKDNLTEIETETELLSTKIKKTNEEIVEHLGKLVEKLQCDLTSSKKQIVLKLSDEVDKFSSFKNVVVNWKSVLDSSIKHGSDKQCLVELQKIKPNMSTLEENIKAALLDTKHVAIKLNLTKALSEIKDNIDLFGKIDVFESMQESYGEGSLPHANFETGSISVLKTLDLGGGSKYCSGIFIGGYIVITIDDVYKVVKYTREGSMISELKLISHPKDICQIRESTVAAVSSENISAIFTVETSNMTLLQTLKLKDTPVYGICYMEAKQSFVVSSNRTLTWIGESSGTKISSKQTAGYSYFITIIDEVGYITLDGEKAVTCTVNDKIKFTYTNNELSGATGFGVDCNGNIYFVSYSFNNIYQITKDGKLIRIIPASIFGIDKPRTIRFEPNSNRLVVASYNGKATICMIE